MTIEFDTLARDPKLNSTISSTNKECLKEKLIIVYIGWFFIR